MPKPNVLVILLDQLTRQALSLYGNAFVHTPNMDALAAETDPIWADQAIRLIKGKPTQSFLLASSLHNPHDICYWTMGQLTPEPDRDALPPLPPNFARNQNEPEFVTTCRSRAHYGNEANWTVDWDEIDWQKYLFAYYR